MTDSPLVWIIIGVAGSGKSLVGRRLAEALDCDFLEGDRRHSQANIAKMLAHQPLGDHDRQQWLSDLETDIRRAIAHHRETVITCSALKAVYRQQFTAPGRVQLVWLDVPQAELQKRLVQRTNHYLKSELLTSQLAAFEPMTAAENAIALDGRRKPDELVTELRAKAIARFPDLAKPWWERGV